MLGRSHQVLMTVLWFGCGVSDGITPPDRTPVISVKSEIPIQEGLPPELTGQYPLWERLREPTFRRSAEAFRVYPDGNTATLSATTQRWEVGSPVDDQQLQALRKLVEEGSFFGLKSSVGEEDSGGRCAKPHGGCIQWSVAWKGRTHWVRRTDAAPSDVERIEASLR